MTAHPLDRPVWRALTSRQAHLAQGDGRAVRMLADYGLFAAAADGSPASLAALAALVPAHGMIATVGTAEPGPVPGVRSETHEVWQMVANAITPADPPAFEIVALTEADAPQMLALATLTKPGPFFGKTHVLGDFVGVKAANGELLAMAGERMKPTGFTEVSGVCTAPTARGKGYAGALMRLVANRILARGETPFLHAYAANTGAIGLYHTLGFQLRAEVVMTALSR